MGTQRVRHATGKAPSRHDIRQQLVEFNEADNAFTIQRQASAPIGGPQALPGVINDDGTMVLQPDPLVAARVEQDVLGIRAYDAADAVILNVDTSNGTILAKGNITGGSITLDDTSENSSYWYLADDVGLTSRISGTDTKMSSLRASYLESPTDVHQRQWLLTVNDLGPPYGTDVGRAAFIQVFNSKHEGNEAAETVDNRSMVLLRAKVEDGGTEVVAYVEATNTQTNFQVQGADVINLLPTTDGRLVLAERLQVTGTPWHQESPLSVSNYADGTQGWYVISESDSAGFGGTAATILSGVNDVPVIAGRKYRVTYYSRTLNIPDAGDEVEVWIERDSGAGFGRIGDGKWQSAAAGENFGAISVEAFYQPTGTANVDFRVRAQRTSGTGTTNVLGGSASSPMYLLVEGIGW